MEFGHELSQYISDDSQTPFDLYKEANIGIAMDHSGSDVAKDVSDITFVDDNFLTIVSAIEEVLNVSIKIRIVTNKESE